MEFKFRAGDQRPPKYPSPRPPVLYCFSKQGLPDVGLSRSMNSNLTRRNPFETNESMHFEMELMRLREEKLLLEIERQRFLKEEAKRELMLFEREIAIRGGAQSVRYSFREQHRWGTTAPSPVVQTYHELQKMPQQQQPRSSDRLVCGAVVLPPRVQPFTAGEKKEELIVLEKPDPSVFREKLKAERPSTSTVGIEPFGVKKNPKDEWSCALCQVTASSERTFNHHLHGKKHKRKEAGLMAQKTSKSKLSQAAPEQLPNVFREKRKAEMSSTSTVDIEPFGVKKNPKDEWSCAPCQTTLSSERMFNEHLHAKKHMSKEACLMAQKVSKSNVSLASPEPLPNVFREKRKAETPLPSPSTSLVDIQPFGVKKNPKDEWSCALCQTTMSSERMFNEHLHGKKHRRKEAGRLMAQEASKGNVSQAAPEPLPNKRIKLLGVTETYGSATEGRFDLNRIIPNFLNLGGKEDKQENELVIEQNLKTEDVSVGKNKFKLWCEKCKVGAYTTDVMSAHLKGKKHQANLDQSNGTGQPLLASAVTSSKLTMQIPEPSSTTGVVR